MHLRGGQRREGFCRGAPAGLADHSNPAGEWRILHAGSGGGIPCERTDCVPARVERPAAMPIVKRTLDIVITLLLAPVWLFALVVVALLVRWKLGSPVFFRQARPGLGGRPFQMIKFRSM